MIQTFLMPIIYTKTLQTIEVKMFEIINLQVDQKNVFHKWLM